MTETEKIVTLPTPISPTKKYIAELIGTMVLVLMGCGSAVIAGYAIWINCEVLLLLSVLQC